MLTIAFSLPPDLRWQLLADPTSLLCLTLTALCLIVLLGCVRAVVRLRRPPGPLPRGEGASATLEFALVFPILLFFSLLLTQTTLVMGANVYVHYAAFAAARTAIVQIPADLRDEPPNVLLYDATGRGGGGDSGSAKQADIQRAAAIALLPVAGRLDGDQGAELAQGLSAHYAAYGRRPPAWVGNFAAQRLNYALANTRVRLLRTTNDTAPGGGGDPHRVVFTPLPDGEARFGPREPITVRVAHHQNLAVPYVNLIFPRSADHPIFAIGHDSADDFEHTGRGRYSVVAAQCTLTNEGVVDALPPRPAARRLEPGERVP